MFKVIAKRLRIPANARLYHEKVIDHYEKPRNVGSLNKKDINVGTGLVGAPACGDVMKLQILVDDETGEIKDVKFKTFGCGSAIASSSLVTEKIKGLTVWDAMKITNVDIAKELSLPPVKLHCSNLRLLAAELNPGSAIIITDPQISPRYVPEGLYIPLYQIYLYPHASGLDNVTFRTTVKSKASNLELLMWASNSPNSLRDQMSEISLKACSGGQHAGKWITLRGPMIKVGQTTSVDFSVEDKTPDIKTGFLIASISLEPVPQKHDSGQFKCHIPGCGRLFTRPFNLKSHLETHNPARNKSHQCAECHAQFYLARHAQIHNRTMIFNCAGCNRTFSRKDALKRHLRTSKSCPAMTSSDISMNITHKSPTLPLTPQEPIKMDKQETAY
ncbi:iron-binding protein [Terramyces sp. JEL0728]|nr:iron-binding protein [Terramyces sp. JEL0728]